MTISSAKEKRLMDVGISKRAAKLLADSAIPKYNTLTDVPTGFSGTAQVGTQLYVGDGVTVVAVGETKGGVFPGKMMWDFSTLSGYSVTSGGVLTLVDVQPHPSMGKTMTKSIKVTVPAGTGDVDFIFPDLGILFPVQNPTNTISMVIEPLSLIRQETLYYVLYLAVDASYSSYYALIDNFTETYKQSKNLFQSLSTPLGMGEKVGTPTPSTITAGKIRLPKQATRITEYILHGITVAPSGTAAVAIVMDDGHHSAITEIAPYLGKHNLKAGFSLIADLPYLSDNDMAALSAAGHDLIGHGQFSLSSYANVSLALADIDKNIDYLRNKGYYNRLYTYAEGVDCYSETDTLSVRNKLLSKNVNVAFKVGNADSGIELPLGGLNGLGITRFPINEATTLLQLQNALTDIELSGNLLVLMVHAVFETGASGDAISRTKFRLFCDEIGARVKAGKVINIKPSQIAEYYGIS